MGGRQEGFNFVAESHLNHADFVYNQHVDRTPLLLAPPYSAQIVRGLTQTAAYEGIKCLALNGNRRIARRRRHCNLPATRPQPAHNFVDDKCFPRSRRASEKHIFPAERRCQKKLLFGGHVGGTGSGGKGILVEFETFRDSGRSPSPKRRGGVDGDAIRSSGRGASRLNW